MQPVTMPALGEVVVEEKGTTIILFHAQPVEESHNTIYLRFAFVTRGTGGNVFPGFLLDDWGREIRGLKLYDWVKKNGEQFPRAEIFGFEEDGRETQCFLREIELYARLPAYVFQDRSQPVTDGQLIHSILLPTGSISTAKKIARPSQFDYPLRSAMVNWWQIPVGLSIDEINLAESQPDPGF